jgi:branched-chain amino acid transport system permease protein
MLSLAFSMILYGLLVKTSQLGSTDGFGLSVKTFAGIALGRPRTRYVIFAGRRRARLRLRGVHAPLL